MDDKDPIAKAIETLAFHVKYLGNGNAATSMGAIEGLAVQITEVGRRIADAIEKLAEAVENQDIGQAIRDVAEDLRTDHPLMGDGGISTALNNIAEAIQSKEE